MAWLTKKRLFALHGWLGLTLGLPLFIICFSGAFAVMSPELDRMLHPEMRVIPPADPSVKPLSWGTLVEKAEAASPGGAVVFMDAAPERDSAWQATVAYSPKDQRLVYIDPFTGLVQGQTTPFNVRSFFRIFHKQFYITGGSFWPHGRVIVCSFSIVLFLSALTGLMFCRGWWKHLFRLRIARGRRIFWSDLHRFAGVWSFVLAIMFAVTGFWYLLVRLMEDFGIAEHDPLPGIPAETIAGRPAVMRRLGLDELVERARKAYPEFGISAVSLGSGPASGVGFYGKAPYGLSPETSDRVFVDPYSGEILALAKTHGLPLAARVASLADPIHFGRFGGYFTKLIWTGAGLALGIGVLAGTILWWQRTRREAAGSFRRQRGWAMASLGLNLAILGIAAVSTYAFIRAQVKGPESTEPAISLGQTDLGPWLIEGFLHGKPKETEGSFSFRFVTEGDANYRAAYLWSGGEARPKGLKAIGGSRVRLFASSPVRGGAMTLELEGWDGSVHRGSFPLAPVSGESGPDLVPPPPPGVRLGVWLVSGGFLAAMGMTAGFWMARVR